MCYSFYLQLNANIVTNNLTSDDVESCGYDVFQINKLTNTKFYNITDVLVCDLYFQTAVFLTHENGLIPVRQQFANSDSVGELVAG